MLGDSWVNPQGQKSSKSQKNTQCSQCSPGADSGTLSRSQTRRPRFPGSLDREPVEAPKMLTASISSASVRDGWPTTSMSRLMKRTRQVTDKIEETGHLGWILVVLFSNMFNSPLLSEQATILGMSQQWNVKGISKQWDVTKASFSHLPLVFLDLA